MRNRRIVIALSIFFVVYLYLGERLISTAGLRSWLQAFLWVFLGIPFFLVAWLPIVYWREEKQTPSRIEHLLIWGSFVSMGLMSFVLCLTLLRDLSFILSFTIEGSLLHWRYPPLLVSIFGAKATLAILGLSSVGVASGMGIALRGPEIEHVVIPFADLADDLEGFRIVQISDLHIGPTIRQAYVEDVVRKVNSLNPDLVALTGDLVDGEVQELREIFSLLGRIRAGFGVFYVTGNHEFYWGAEKWVEEAKRVGLVTLINQNQLIEKGRARVLVAGVTDFWAGEFKPEWACDPKRALDGAPGSDFKLLLAHQPKTAIKACELDYDLQISGHTHGGQFIPWVWVVRLFEPRSRGLHRMRKMWLYVSRGTGSWGPPIRLGSPPEITLIELTGPSGNS